MISGIVTPPIYAYNDPDAFWVYGDPLMTKGLVNRCSLNGIGAVTRGLVWQVKDNWFDNHFYSNLSSTWVIAYGASVATTSWVLASGASVATTTWAEIYTASVGG